MSKTCPNGHRMRELQTHCSACGWNEGDNPQPSFNNHQCAYRDGDQECPLTGTITDSPKTGPTTKWYCRYHHNWREDKQAASQNLSFILSGELTSNQRSWKDEALHEQGVKLKQKHPEIFMKGNSRQDSLDIAEANLALIRRIEKEGVTKPLPYDKNKLIEGKSYAEDEALQGFSNLDHHKETPTPEAVNG